MKLYSAVASLWHSASRVSNSPCQLVWNRLKSKAQNYRMPTFTRRDMFLLWLQHGRLWIHGQIWQISQWCRDGTLSPFQAVVILSIKSRIGSFQKTRNICQSNLTTMEWIKLKQLGGELEFTMKCIDVESKLLHLHQICRAWSLQSWTECSISEYTITRNLFRIIMVGLLMLICFTHCRTRGPDIWTKVIEKAKPRAARLRIIHFLTCQRLSTTIWFQNFKLSVSHCLLSSKNKHRLAQRELDPFVLVPGWRLLISTSNLPIDFYCPHGLKQRGNR